MLQTPVTSASYALAIWTANSPTPPEAPMIMTRCPAVIWPTSRNACSAVHAEVGMAAACSKVRRAGLGARVSTRAVA